MFISSNFIDMSNVIHHTIYSSVENMRFKLKEAEQFVIKLFYPFIISCYRSQFTSMVKYIALFGISSPEEYNY